MTDHEAAGAAAARRLFGEFHEHEPNRVLSLNVPEVPAEAVLLGEVQDLTYHVPEGVPSEKGHDADYTHDFGDRGFPFGNTGAKPYLLAHPTAPGVLYVVSKPSEPKFKVDDWIRG